jgi:putative phosphoribosyl transferase
MNEVKAFRDRHDAGRQLASAVARFRHQGVVVVALPRGGVPVGYEIAVALHAPLDVLFVRKLGAPGFPELGLGAVVDGHQPQRIINRRVVDTVRPPPGWIDAEERRQLALIEQRKAALRLNRPPVPVEGRTVLLVDDGIATGGTVAVALQALSRSGARRIVLAVPVAPPDIQEQLGLDADEFVCLLSPPDFRAVGAYYDDFAQTTDDEVIELLDRAGAQALQH